jgi:hypothetical protein
MTALMEIILVLVSEFFAWWSSDPETTSLNRVVPFLDVRDG